ncbi:MAG: SPFH domain-containing protein [Christensenellaceae bacterium]|jgi:membrane protease subunit (stomatin/prohibitin family)|nr:SPFH domain-containing protein [Christensenellaceae bacterium]
MGLLKNIEWTSDDKNTIVYKVNLKDDYVSKGSALTVRDGQVAIFSHRGKMADVFLPGYYKLDTTNIPILTKLMSWKYGFENVFRSDLYFVKTTQFTNEKWGTSNPIILRDKDYGGIRIRGFGTYSFRVDDAFVFLTQLSGTNSTFKTGDISEYLRSIVIMGITDALGESQIPILDMSSNLMELSKEVEKKLLNDFKEIGLSLVKFNFQNFSLPENLEKAFDKSAELGMLGKNMSTYVQMAQADALVEAAKNQGGAGQTIGAGLGLGMGAGLGSMFGGMYNNVGSNANASISATPMTNCSKCGAHMNASAKFCPECGASNGVSCPKCKATVKSGAKFCSECGTVLSASCPKCKAQLKDGAKFCPECGEKI